MQIRLALRPSLRTFGAICALAMALACPVTWISPAYAADDSEEPAKPTQTARKEIGEIFQAARAFAVDKKYPETLAKLQEADAIPNHTPYEQGLLDQLRIIAALETDNIPVAIKALDGLPDTMPLEQKARYVMVITTHFFNEKDYANAIDWAKRYIAMGGPEQDKASKVLGRSYYFTKDYPNALLSSLDGLDKAEKAGVAPGETDLEILGEVALKQKDNANYTLALKKLVAYYPTTDRWDDLINAALIHPGFPWEKRALDIFRLKLATGTMPHADQYNDYATVAMQAGFPGEAETALERSPDSGKQTPLRAKVRKDYDADQKSLAKAETDAAKAASGEILVKLGIDYYGYGQYDKAISLIQAGIAKGGLKSVDDANLDLGIVYLAAGQKDKALETLKAINTSGGPAELAQLWLLKANAPN